MQAETTSQESCRSLLFAWELAFHSDTKWTFLIGSSAPIEWSWHGFLSLFRIV
ncbi:hypothetical protein L209DRAFT_18390 [Thermothelomyces heterothallicus CBS 203.75]